MLAMVALLAFDGAGCSAKAKKAYHLSRANRFYTAGQFNLAEIEYQNVLRNDPVNGLAWSRIGLIYYEQGRIRSAAPFLARASTLVPNDLNLRLKLGFIYASLKMTNALEEANYVLERKPLDDEAPLLLAEAVRQPKEIAAARQRLQTLAHAGDRAVLEVALGNLALREKDLAAAGAALKKAQALNAKFIPLTAALGTLAEAQGDLKQAEALFKAAADASPIRSPRRITYAQFKMQVGDLAGARQFLNEMVKAAADYFPAPLLLAEIAAQEKKYDECAGWLDKALALDPDNMDALFFEGQLKLQRGQTDQAVVIMERLVRMYPQVALFHYTLGNAYYQANDSVKAAGSLNRSLELETNFFDATILLAQIQIKNNNPAPAIITLERLRQKQPQLAKAQLLLADAYRQQARIDGQPGLNNNALAIYQSLEKKFPKDEQIPLLRGATLLQMQDPAAARQAFERVLELSPSQLQAIATLVDLDLTDKKFDAAMQLVNAELQKDPKRVELNILLARIFQAEGKGDQTEATLLKTIEIAPTNLSAYLLLAKIYSDAGQNDKAMAKLDAVMSKEPTNALALYLTATIYNANKDYKGAAATYEKELKLEANPVAMNNLAYIYSEFLPDNLDRGYEVAQNARKLLPHDASTADTLGWICFKKGSYSTALGLLQESAGDAQLQAQPEVQFHFGMANYMTANEAPARAAFQLALQSRAAFSGRDECQRCLSILDLNPATADAAARFLLEKRISEKADDPVALVRLARIYLRDGNAEKAVTAYEALLQAIPKNLEAMIQLTRLYAAKDTKKAYEMAKAANKLAPYNPEVTHALGRLAFLSGDYQLAANLLQQAVQTRSDDAPLLFDYAQAAYSLGKTAEAQTALQNALNLNLPAAQAASVRRMLDLMGLAAAPAQAAAASSRIAEILKSEPDDVPALLAQAIACEAKADLAGAEQACEKILARYPDFSPAQKQLAWLYAAEPAKADRAYALAAKAREAFPNDPTLEKIIGVILVQRGDYTHAVNLLKHSAATFSTDAELFYYLGTAQFHLKSRLESKTSLQQALALKLSGQPAEAAKQMLNQLK